jgi:uncharacterized protein YoxC
MVRSLRPGLLPIVFLIVVLAFAVWAIVMLTITLIAAGNIDHQVGVINRVYPPIIQNTQAVGLARTTARVAGEINEAARPLGPAFTHTVAAADGIAASANSIQKRAKEINDKVHSIHSTVQSIGGAVNGIGATLSSVNDKAQSIRDAATGIQHSFHRILDHVIAIDDEAKGINVRVLRVRDAAERIRDDLDRVRHPLVPDIRQNARAIARSPILNPGQAATNPLMTLMRALQEPGMVAKGAPYLVSHPKALFPGVTGSPIQPPHGHDDHDPASPLKHLPGLG